MQADAPHPRLIAGMLDPDPQPAQGAGRGQGVRALQHTMQDGLAVRYRAQDQRPVGDGFVAGQAKASANRAARRDLETQRTHGIHGPPLVD